MSTVFGEITEDGRSIVLMAVGAPEEMAYLARQVQQLTPLLRKTDPPGGLITELTWPTVVQLANVLGPRWEKGPRLASWIQEQALSRAAELPAELTIKVPEGLTPYPWQVSAAHMIARRQRVLLTDTMGTGKTISAVLGLLEWVEQRHGGRLPGPVVVVSPSSVVHSWVETVSWLAPHLRVVDWRGPKRYQHLGQADVYVTSYDTARQDVKDTAQRKAALLELAPVGLVCDECHNIKSPTARRRIAVKKIAASTQLFVALSGTPITKDTADLWTTLDILVPHAWPSRERWVHRYCLTTFDEYREYVLGLNPGTEGEFRLALLGQERRVAKADVLGHLPPKVYSVRTAEMPPKWRKVYDSYAKDMLAELPDSEEELSTMDTLAKLTHLQLLSCAAADVEYKTETLADGTEKRHTHIKLKSPSWKVDALLELLDERPSGSAPVIVFASSKQLIDLAGAAVAESGRRVGYIVGGQSAKRRTETVDAFQAGELDVLLATTQAGGVGLTLTAADTVVFLQRPWSLVDSTQAEDRAHRPGSEQHESIQIVDIVTSNTIDAKIRAALKEKAGQLAELVKDPRIVAELLGGR